MVVFFTNSCIFVNEVLESDNLKKFKYCINKRFYKRDFKPKYRFEKHFFDLSQQPTEKDYNEDAYGRRYRNVAVFDVSEEDEYVADKSLVVPRYLIVIGPTPKFLNKFKLKEVDSKLNKCEPLKLDYELNKGKPLNLDLELIKNEFTNL